jgi:acyl transferase domain-containing protein/acyl carrier protein
MMSDTEVNELNEAVAIVGMAGRFPGAAGVEQFWQNLCRGVESITFFGDEELRASGVAPEDFGRNGYVKAKPVLDDMEMFDASFFGFTPREAELMDPQHRVFLECAWAALERAGYDAGRYAGKIGVYAGASLSTYVIGALRSLSGTVTMGALQQLGIGNGLATFATRVSYALDLRGPSVSVQTACSTSLAAVHLACQSLLGYQCDMALAGGVSIILPSREGYQYEEGGIFSPDGHCRPFDARGAGTLVGDGAGVVVLKRLSEALEDGDHIHALIKGSAMNNDGSQKVGFTAPSVKGQVEVIAEAQAVAGVHPAGISYVEAHGTGTRMGDPIEVKALTEVFRAGTSMKGFCAIGSLKANIGHLDTAAGVASLIKTALSLEHKQLPPTINFESPNPEIDFANSPFYVNTRHAEWPAGAGPRRAGVSSFGFGGTNVHLVLEEAPPPQATQPSRPWHIVALSAKTEEALDAAADNLRAHLEERPGLELADAAYTYLVGRKAFDVRRFVVCRDAADAAEALRARDPQRVIGGAVAAGPQRPVVFMFPGQGAQHVGMAGDLYRTEPTFRQHFDRCCELLRPHLGLDLRRVVFAPAAEAVEAARQLEQTWLTQPALFCVEYALAQLWMGWGVRPQAMLGHSIGEYVAACLAGVLSLEDALTLVAGRGRLLQRLPGGSMLAVPLSEQELTPLLAGRRLCVAATNGPATCVVAGAQAEVEEFEKVLGERRISSRRLHTSHAFHSEMVEPALREFVALFKGVRLSPPQTPFVSNVTGTWISAAQATDPEYWARHLRQTVRFAEGVQELLREPGRILLEVGPGQTLSALARQQAARTKTLVVSSLPRPGEEGSDAASALGALGRLWLAGVGVDWQRFYAHEERRRVPLPTYQFERRRHWITQQPQAVAAPPAREGKRADVAEWFYMPVWKQSAPAAGARAGRDAREAEAGRQEGECLLVFADGYGLGSKLSEGLRREGRDAVMLRAGDDFAAEPDGSYVIDPRRPDDYDALFASLEAAGKTPTEIIHLWSVAPPGGARASIEAFDRAQEQGFYSLLHLAQALGRRGVTRPVRLLVISSGLQSVTGDEPLCPEKATLLSPCKVIPQELPNVSCRSVDVILPPPGTRREEALVVQLLEEWLSGTDDAEVAYRGRMRWVQAFERVETAAAGSRGSRLKEGGVYLVVGGFGDIGTTLAESIAREAKARLALTVDGPFPARRQWAGHLETHGEADETSRRIRRVRELEAMGAEVLVVSAQSRDATQMRAAVVHVLERFGALDGVLHAERETVTEEEQVRTIQESGRDDWERHLRARAEALYALADALADAEPGFVLFVSSISSVLGGLGLAAYAGANALTDAFARDYGERSAAACVCVNLDSWRGEDEREHDHPAGVGASLSELSISPREGLEVFSRILAGAGPSQLIISTGDLQTRLDRWVGRTLSQEATPPRRAAGLTRASADSYVAPRNEVEQKIADIWRQVMGIEEIGVEDNFFELGGNSLLATQLVSRMREALSGEISLRSFFENATIAGVASATGSEARPAAARIKPIARDSIRVSRASLQSAALAG